MPAFLPGLCASRLQLADSQCYPAAPCRIPIIMCEKHVALFTGWPQFGAALTTCEYGPERAL